MCVIYVTFFNLEMNFDSSMIGNVQSGIPILAKVYIAKGDRNEYSGMITL